MTEQGICNRCGESIDTHPTIDVRHIDQVGLCQVRSMKWQRVEPGTVIPAGQPYRVERRSGWERNTEYIMDKEHIAGKYADYFIDSSWKPPLVLPTEPCVIRAKVAGPVPYRVLFGHPNPGEEGGMTFCRDVDGLTYKADEIELFEVLWREGERGKDALVPWEAIDKLRDAYPSDPGADMTPVDWFLREVVGDR